MEELLLKIAENTSREADGQIILSGNNAILKQRFNPPIELNKNKKYKAGLTGLSTYYSFPNIDQTNNRLKYSPDNGVTWINIYIN